MKLKTCTPLVVFITMLLFASCQESNDTIKGSAVDLTKLAQSMAAVEAGSSKAVKTSDPTKIPETREDLGDMKTVVQVYDINNIGNLSVPGFGNLKLGKDEKNLNVYYLETKSVINGTDTSVYGIGYSVHYLFKKMKKGLSVDKLPFVAASVQLEGNKTEVYYSIQSYGITGQPLVKFFKPVVNKQFDVEGFGLMQSYIDGIHNVLSDSVLNNSLRFTPHRFNTIKASEL